MAWFSLPGHAGIDPDPPMDFWIRLSILAFHSVKTGESFSGLAIVFLLIVVAGIYPVTFDQIRTECVCHRRQ